LTGALTVRALTSTTSSAAGAAARSVLPGSVKRAASSIACRSTEAITASISVRLAGATYENGGARNSAAGAG
jgi:hypothetical protein